MGHIGESRRRVEDLRLVTGGGRYADDVRLPGELHLALRRSEQPHGRITSIDASVVRSIAGVVGVFTAADLPDIARRVMDDMVPPHLVSFSRPVLAAGEVKHVGEAVAAVVAVDPYTARDAAEAVRLLIEPLPAAGTLESAIAGEAPLVHENLGTNVGWWGEDGFGDVDAAFAGAGVVVSDRIVLGRVAGGAIEPRAAVAAPLGDGLEHWASTQARFRVRDMLAKGLGLSESLISIGAADVGGGFGPKGRRCPEDLLVAWVALHLGRPVRWTAARTEDSAASVQAHGSIFELELAADPDGTLRGLRGILWHDIGAYASIGALLPGSIFRNMLCTYRLPAAALQIRDVFTNTVPTGTVRGGGGPEGNFAMERMLDLLAFRLDIAPAELRRRNLITPREHPYGVGLRGYRMSIDSGDSERMLDEAQRQLARVEGRDDGRLRGIGVALGIEHVPGVFREEPARIRIRPDGVAEVMVGSSPQGQGHESMVAQVAADRLCWPIERIEVSVADTTMLPPAGPTASSRSAVNVGNAVAVAASAARSRLLALAAQAMRVDAPDLEIKEGWVVTSDGGRRPAADFLSGPEVDVTEIWRAGVGTGPASCHAVQVAVDGETGAIEVERYVVVYDSGVLINPRIVEGQLHGAVVHGLGYALAEEMVYAQDGSLLTPSFHEYDISSAPEVAFATTLVSMPTPTGSNPEGFKGAGEVGTIAAPAAIAAAVEAALRQVAPNARISALPIRAERVLALIVGPQAAGATPRR